MVAGPASRCGGRPAQRVEARVVSAKEIQQAELHAEGDRVAAEFGLGQRAGAWSRRKRSDGWGCGWVLLLAVIFTGVVLFTPIPQPWHLIVMGAYGAALLLAVLLITGSRSWQERLFRYEQGIAEFASREPAGRAALGGPGLAEPERRDEL